MIVIKLFSFLLLSSKRNIVNPDKLTLTIYIKRIAYLTSFIANNNKLTGLNRIEISKEYTKQHSLMGPTKKSDFRTQAFQTFVKDGYEELARKYGEMNIKGQIKNLLRIIVFKLLKKKS